ncbi:MAG: YidC/Oxa1 family membrane protein insertase [Blautia sp.]|nr:YidC/Oxa1 family membrane protein insertase [Blautia sp.]
MDFILLTQNSTPIIGQVAKLLGWIMNGIFYVIDKIGIPNVGLAIILFTIVIYMLMMPLTIKQQKFSKLSAKMNPELQAIQAKYKGKTDNDSAMAQNAEIQAVYAKYGVSPSGSCVQLLIQMPILFALYRVIYAMPAYVTKIGNTFRVLAEKIISVDNGAFIQNSGVESIANTVAMYGKSLTEGTNISNGIIDVLNKLSSTDLAAVAEHYDLSRLTYEGQLILNSDTTRGLIDTYNIFLGMNMADSPMTLIRSGWMAGTWGLVIGAALIPILSAVTQWINVKLMPQAPENKENEQASSMAQSMKTMNMVMPVFSAWLCLSMPAGMGLYWVAGSVVRSVQQVLINKHIDKMDFEEIIQKNSVKSAKKMEKIKKQQEMMKEYSSMNTRNIQSKATTNTANTSSGTSQGASSTAKPGSMMAKANMVKEYNERNNNK